MPDIAAVLKSEIARLAKKAIRQEVETLKKQVAAHRHALADLKRKNTQLERDLRDLTRNAKSARDTLGADDQAATPPSAGKRGFRYSAAWLTSWRKSMGLSAAECGALCNVSGNSVYKWENGIMPRQKHQHTLAELAKLGKRALRAKLAAIG